MSAAEATLPDAQTEATQADAHAGTHVDTLLGEQDGSGAINGIAIPEGAHAECDDDLHLKKSTVTAAAVQITEAVSKLATSRSEECPRVGLCVERGKVLDASAPMCTSCNEACEPTDMVSRWRCKKCNFVRSYMSRTFGAWPNDGFRDLSEAEQQLFYRDAKKARNDKELLKSIVSRTLSRTHSEIEKASKGGTYLPLSVLTTQGYDMKTIVAKCTDTKEHEFLGTCYNLNLVSKLTEDEQRTSRHEEHRKSWKRDSSSSHSSSSSSSESTRAKKKVTKAKKRSSQKKGRKPAKKSKAARKKGKKSSRK